MTDPRFTGSGVALVTPFDPDGVNEEVLRRLVRFHHEQGTDALVVCGTTGEAATMTVEEQRDAAAIVIDENGGRLPVVVGCGGSDPAEVAHRAANAAAVGADALLVSAPPYSKPTQRGIMAYYRKVLNTADLPLILYNVPGRTAVNIEPETIAELADDDRLIGVKEASGDIGPIAELARLTGGRLALWSGNDDQVLPVLALGGSGVITVLGNLVPAAVSRMVHRFLDGDVEGARTLQLRYLPLIRALFAEPNPIPVKTAVRWLGFDVGPLRLPLTPMAEATERRLIAALREIGLTSGRPLGPARRRAAD